MEDFCIQAACPSVPAPPAKPGNTPKADRSPTADFNDILAQKQLSVKDSESRLRSRQPQRKQAEDAYPEETVQPPEEEPQRKEATQSAQTTMQELPKDTGIASPLNPTPAALPPAPQKAAPAKLEALPGQGPEGKQIPQLVGQAAMASAPPLPPQAAAADPASPSESKVQIEQTPAADKLATPTKLLNADTLFTLPAEQAAAPAKLPEESESKAPEQLLQPKAIPIKPSAFTGKAEDVLQGALSQQDRNKPAPPETPPPEITQAAGIRVAEGTTKLFEPARLAEAHKPELTLQVSQGVQALIRSGQGSMKVHLYPEELGKIDLQLTVKPEGTYVVVSAEHPATGALLERHLNDLRQSLLDAGVKLGGLSVNQDHRNAQSQARPWLQEAPSFLSVFKAEPSPLAETSPGFRNEYSTGVDYRI